MISLRPYQSDAVKSIWDYFGKFHGNPLVALPTGTGKSLVIAFFLKSVFDAYPGQRVMMLTHVKELIRQNYEELKSYWEDAPAGIYSAGLNQRDSDYPITFAGIASVAKKPELFGKIDLIIVDEAHLVSPTEDTMYQSFIDALKKESPLLKVIGLTATPWRLSSGLLTENPKKGKRIFTDICYDGVSTEAFNKMIEDGYLCDLIPLRTDMTYDTSSVHIRGGEFVEKELQELVNSKDAVSAAIKEAKERCSDRKHWLVFATGIDHTETVCKMLNEEGVSATCVHSKMSSEERDAAIAGFKEGKYQAIVNNNVLTTGFNFPAIDLILCLRPTMSSSLWVQMLGRGTRPAPGKKNCIVLDFAGNTANLGPINSPVIKVAGGGKKKTKERKCLHCGEDVIPTRKNTCPACGASFVELKDCPKCRAYVPSTAKVCPHCSHSFPEDYRYSSSSGKGELVARKGRLMALPTVETHAVREVVVMRHEKQGKPPCLRVSYYCGFKRIDQYLCFEHGGYAANKAKQWWYNHKVAGSGQPLAPVSVAEAMKRLLSDEIQFPAWIRVMTTAGSQYPDVTDFGFEQGRKVPFKVSFANFHKKAA